MSLLVALLLLVFQGTGVVTGRLVMASGAPAANVRVALAPVDDRTQLASITQTDSLGRYRLENVSPGQYHVTAGPVDSPTFLPGTRSRDTAIIISVTAGATLDVPDFNSRLSRFRGRVVRQAPPAGESQAPLWIELGPQLFAEVFPDGSFEFPSVLAGSYAMTFKGNVNLPVQSIQLTEKDTDDYVIEVPLDSMAATVTGTVRLEPEGLPMLPVMQLVLTNAQGASRTTVLPPKFSVAQLPLGQYSLSLQNLPEGLFVKSMTSGSLDLRSQKLTLTAAAPPPIDIVIGLPESAWLRVTGHFTNIDDYKLPEQIFLTGPSQRGPSPTAKVRADGSFEFEKILAGSYTVFMVPRLDDTRRTLVINKDHAAGVELPLHIPDTYRISGAIVGLTTFKQGATTFQLVPTIRVGRRAAGRPTYLADVHPDGNFEFRNIPPGTYSITLTPMCTGCGPGSDISGGISVAVGNKDVTGIRLSGR
jgi:Carboxypeptidase regulatory-like domain